VLEELTQERKCHDLEQRRVANLEGKLGAAQKSSEAPETIEERPERVQSHPHLPTGAREVLEGREERPRDTAESRWAGHFFAHGGGGCSEGDYARRRS
jgi:hypothetical protein